MLVDRTLAYRDKIRHTAYDDGEFHYVVANQALDAIRTDALKGVEPSEQAIDGVRYRLDSSAAHNETTDPFRAYRSKMLSAHVIPIVFAEVINVGLGNGSARRVSERLGLRDSYSQTLAIAENALEEYDTARSSHKSYAYNETPEEIAMLTGVLNEITPIALMNRHATGKLFAVPSTVYEDEMNAAHERADGILYDQRRRGVKRRKNPFQAKGSMLGNRHYSIPVITGIDMANQYKASSWPQDDERFTTLRKLIVERNGEADAKTQSTLDRLSTYVISKALS